jgi:hypothetical protein
MGRDRENFDFPIGASQLTVTSHRDMMVLRMQCFLAQFYTYEGVSKSFRTESITKYTLTTVKKTLVEKQHKGLWRQNSQNSDIAVPSDRVLYHLQFSLQTSSSETSGYVYV